MELEHKYLGIFLRGLVLLGDDVFEMSLSDSQELPPFPLRNSQEFPGIPIQLASQPFLGIAMKYSVEQRRFLFRTDSLIRVFIILQLVLLVLECQLDELEPVSFAGLLWALGKS